MTRQEAVSRAAVVIGLAVVVEAWTDPGGDLYVAAQDQDAFMEALIQGALGPWPEPS